MITKWGGGGGRKKVASLIQSYKIYTKRQLKRVKWKLVYLIRNKPIKKGVLRYYS